jgi:hypothetical protein
MKPSSSDIKVEALGNYGATLSLIEVGLGTLLHSLHVPFAGVLLSLNQGYLLCRVTIKTNKRWMAYSVSNIAAILKSLSPAGNKLGPMLSLSMQGLLFTLGTSVLGATLPGLILGMLLLSVWSFVQPLVTYYLFFGDTLFSAADFWFQKSFPFHGLDHRALALIISSVVILKMIAAVILAIVAWKRKGEDTYQDRFTTLAKPKEMTSGHPALLALKDLFRPAFIGSILLTGIFLFFSQHKLNEIIGHLMRPLALGFIFFYFSRTFTLDRWLKKLHGGRLDSFAKGCEIALTKIRKVI